MGRRKFRPAVHRRRPLSKFAYATRNGFTGRKHFPQPLCGGVAVLDYDNDGWKDLSSANGDVDSLRAGAGQHDTLFRNLDGRRFQDVSEAMGKNFLQPGFQRGAAFADLNNDGFLEIGVTSLGRRPRILFNQGGPGHWLLVDAPGASVKVTTPTGRSIYNHSSVSVGLLSSSDPRIHFGLGAGSRADIEIRWPGGFSEIRRNALADQILVFRKPSNSRNASPR